jgi:hypothetical protein
MFDVRGVKGHPIHVVCPTMERALRANSLKRRVD